MKERGERVTFLVVDDDEVAIMGMRRAISKLGLSNPIEIAGNGEEALDKLRSDGPVRRPFIVTLDLNMPRMGGLEFLEAVRSDESLHDAIVFVMTTSDAPMDITRAFEKNIAGYIVKDKAFETLKEAIAMLQRYTNVVRLPEDSDARSGELRLA